MSVDLNFGMQNGGNVELKRQNQSSVRTAIAQASDKTGVDFSFLLATAKRESSLNPFAKAKSSSAKGLFQFLDQTWLSTLKKHGAKHGLEDIASLISTDSAGRAYVKDAASRKQILNMRYDPSISSIMAAEYASDNGKTIEKYTGQEPQPGDLYAAHFLGAKGAADLINAASSNPNQIAASLFPSAASANKPIFYKNGSALSVAEVLDNLRATAGAADSNSDDGIINKAAKTNYANNDAKDAAKIIEAMQLEQAKSVLGLLSNEDDNKSSKSDIMQSPLLAAQMYQNIDDNQQAQALKMIESIFQSRTLASVLMGNNDNA